MKKYLLHLFTGIFAVISAGCAIQPAVVPDVKTVENDYFRAEVMPINRAAAGPASGYQGFLLTVKNKTGRDMQIDWNQTLYISGGQTDGRFFSEGMGYLSRNQPQPADIVFFNSTFEKAIWPSSLINYESYRPRGFRKMGSGTHGIYLSVRIDDQTVNERLMLTLTEP